MKKIAVFTSIRSEYGLLTPLLKKLALHPYFELRLLVGGAHLEDAYGKTINQIIEDGYPINELFPFLCIDDEKDALTRSLSLLQGQIGKYFSKNPPDLLIILGDRFELIPVVLAALIYNIPIGHISGGEFTEGAIDNQIRHAITKMSHLHFPATDTYRDNIIKMGEEAWRVRTTGEPGLDLLKTITYTPKEELYSDLGIKTSKPIILSTFHPETISNKIVPELVEELLTKILEQGTYHILVTASNFDEGGNKLNDLYKNLSRKYNEVTFVKSLGQQRYYSMLTYAALMLGNSSSGLVEAQSFKLPVINVGERQAGRLANINVINTGYNVDQIVSAIQMAESDKFRQSIGLAANIYGDGEACDKIIAALESNNWEQILVKKNTYV